jgi:hypothetical protein
MFNTKDKVYERFNERRAREAHARFIEDPSEGNLLAATEGFMPMIGLVMNQTFRTRREQDKEDLMSIGVLKIIELLRADKVRQGDTGAAFVYTAVRNVMVDAVKKGDLAEQVFDFGAAGVKPPVASASTISGVEVKIFLEQALKIIFASARGGVRFADLPREAALYVLGCFETRLKPVPSLMKAKFGVSNPGFVVKYCQQLVRKEMYRFRDEHGLPSDTVEEWFIDDNDSVGLVREGD